MLELLLNPQINRNRVCCVWPVPEINASSLFIVDMTKLKHPDDVKKDFFGKWIHSGSHTFTFKAKMAKFSSKNVRQVLMVMFSTFASYTVIIRPIRSSAGCWHLCLVS